MTALMMMMMMMMISGSANGTRIRTLRVSRQCPLVLLTKECRREDDWESTGKTFSIWAKVCVLKGRDSSTEARPADLFLTRHATYG
jgi:hypothetical protein